MDIKKGHIFFWKNNPDKYKVNGIWFKGFSPAIIEVLNLKTQKQKDYTHEEFQALIYLKKFIPEIKIFKRNI